MALTSIRVERGGPGEGLHAGAHRAARLRTLHMNLQQAGHHVKRHHLLAHSLCGQMLPAPAQLCSLYTHFPPAKIGAETKGPQDPRPAGQPESSSIGYSCEQSLPVGRHITYLLRRSHELAAGRGPWGFWRRVGEHAALGGRIARKAVGGRLCIHAVVLHLVQRMLRTGGSAGAEADAVILQRAGGAPGVLQSHGLGRMGSMRVPEGAVAVQERPAWAACHMLLASWPEALLLLLLLLLGRAPCTGKALLIGWLQTTGMQARTMDLRDRHCKDDYSDNACILLLGRAPCTGKALLIGWLQTTGMQARTMDLRDRHCKDDYSDNACIQCARRPKAT